jgi:photosystem II stability/assembly factor-like uncharacterized protein
VAVVTAIVLASVLAGAAVAAARAADGWQPATVSGATTSLQFSGIAMGSATVGLAVGDVQQGGAVSLLPSIYRTADGGATWAEVPSADLYGALSGVAFSDAQHAWAVGADYRGGAGQGSLMLASEDAGLTWNAVDLKGQHGLLAVQFPSASVGYATSDSGELYTTANGGADWALSVVAPDDVYLSGLSFSDATHGWVCGPQGNEDFFGSRCYATADGGATWNEVTPDAEAIVFDCDFVAGGTGWVVGEAGRIFHTADGGATWARRTAAIGAAVSLVDVSFADAQNGWAAGSCWPPQNGGRGWAIILHTTDGGATWTQQDVGVTPLVMAVTARDALSAWAVGDNGLVLRTSDGGGAGFTPTARPLTSAMNAPAVRKGATATFRFRVTDPGVPRAKVALLIYDARNKLKKTLLSGFKPTGSVEQIEARLALPAGRYTWRVTCTDYAGRAQAKAGSSTLVVRTATR